MCNLNMVLNLHMTVILISVGNLVRSDIYSAVCKLQKVFEEEEKLQISLNRYIEAINEDGGQVDEDIIRFAEKLKGERRKVKNTRHFVEHPVNVFHLIYRIVVEWKKVIDKILCATCEKTDASEDFNLTLGIVIKNIGHWPYEPDLDGVCNALLRLWRMYKLDLDQLINGQILNDSADPLTMQQILTIVEYFEMRQDEYAEIKWLEALLRRIENESDLSENNTNTIKLVRQSAALYYKVKQFKKAVNCLESYRNFENPGILRDLNLYRSRMETETEHNMTEPIPTYPIYDALCRKDQKSARELSSLKCFWRRTLIPYYRGKEEVVNYVPRVVLFHDVISEKDATLLKAAGQKKFVRSQIVNFESGRHDDTSDDIRVSQTAWTSEIDHPQLQKVTWRISMLTGLSTIYKRSKSHAEQYQVLNYGVGGMYTPHLDNLFTPLWTPENPRETDDIRGTGDRIATWMFYLQDVRAGGATVFPKIKTRIPVVKGSAAFWHNFKRSGEIDYLTEHAGCPVLLGSKWVANKWIRQEGQVFKRLCGLSEEDVDDLPTV